MSSYRLASIPAGEGWVKKPDHLGVRKCPTCKQEKKLSSFFVRGRTWATRRCNRCMNVVGSNYYSYRNPR